MAQENQQIKQLIAQVQQIIRTTGNQTKEYASINRELLKVITLLDSGLSRNEQDAKDLIDKVKKGLKVTDDMASKWANERKVTKSDLDQIFIKFRQLERIHGDIKDQAKEYNEILEDREDLLDLEIDLSKKLFDTYDEINKAISQSRKVAKSLGAESDTILNQIIDKKIPELVKGGLLSPLFDDMFNSMTAADSLVKQIQGDAENLVNSLTGASVNIPMAFDLKSGALDKEIAKMQEGIELENKARQAGLVDFFVKNEELQEKMLLKMASVMPGSNITLDIDTGKVTRAGKELMEGTRSYEMALRKLQKTAGDQKLIEPLKQSFLDISELISKGVKRTEEENVLLREMTGMLDKGSQFLVQATIERQRELDTLRTSLDYEKDRLVLMSKYSTHMQIAENAVNRMGRSFDYLNSILPAGIGDLIGLQRISFTLIDSHREGVKSFFGEISKGQTPAKALQGYFKTFGPSLKLALNPTVLMVASVALIFKFVSDITGKFKEMSKEMEISLSQAQQFHELQLNILTSHKNQFATMSDIQEIQKTMISGSGKVFDLFDKANQELVIGLSDMGKAFGYGNEQAVKLHKTFENLGASKTLAESLQGNLGLMSEMAGISPQIVAQDLIDSSEEVFTYFAGMPEKAAKAAIEVRRMGMSLKQAGQIAQKMLDLEGFMTDMYELQAMTGPGGIDFSRAFDKGLMGDVQGMTEEIMKQIGSTAELNRMDFLTRMKIAKTLGMTTEELSKSVMLKEKMAALDPQSAAYLEGNLDRMGDISKLTKDQIKDRLKQLQSTDRLGVAWDKIKGTFVKALLPLVEIFANTLEALMPIIDILVGGFKVVGFLLNGILKVVSIITIPFKYIGNLLDGIIGGVDQFFGTTQKVEEPIQNVQASLFGIKDLVTGIASGLGLWFVGKNLFKGLGIVKTGLGSLFGFIPMIGSAFSKMFSSVKAESKVTQIVANKNLQQITPGVVSPGGKKKKKDGGTLAAGGTKIISALAMGALREFMTAGKEAEGTIDGVTQHADLLFGGLMLFGDDLFYYLSQGLQKVFEKSIGPYFEKGLSPMKGMADKVFGKIKIPFKNIFKPAEKVPDLLEKNIGPLEKTQEIVQKTTESISPSKDISKKKISSKKVTKKDSLDIPMKSKKPKIPVIDTQEKNQSSVLERLKNMISSSFTGLVDIVKKAWSMLKSTLMEIVNFSVKVLKTISQGIGDSIQKLLGGIAKGLNQFKTSALKGAASLVLVSGALYITAKALQQFARVSWNDVGKGIVSLGMLVGAAMLLGKITGQIIQGAAAIALLGASLIPAAFALNMFGEVKWSSLAKAGVALVGLSIAASLLGTASPMLLLGAVALAAIGAALIPVAYGMKMFNDIDWGSLAKAGVALVGLGVIISGFGALSPVILLGSMALGVLSATLVAFASAASLATKTLTNIGPGIESIVGQIRAFSDINVMDLFGVSTGITAIGASLMAFSSMALGSGLMDSITSLFSGDPIKKLERIAKLANPLQIVAESINLLGSSLLSLSSSLENISLENLDPLKELHKLSTEKLKVEVPERKEVEPTLPEQMVTSNFRTRPFVQDNVRIQPPPKKAVAQDVQMPKKDWQEQEGQESQRIRASGELPYNFDENREAKQTNILLRELINIMRSYADRPNEVHIGKSALGQIGSVIKAGWNNLG